MGTSDQDAGMRRPAGITVNVLTDQGAPLESATIVLYRCPAPGHDDGPPDEAAPKDGKKAPHYTRRVLDAEKLQPSKDDFVATRRTQEGRAEFRVDPGSYVVVCPYPPKWQAQWVDVEPGCVRDISFRIELREKFEVTFRTDDGEDVPYDRASVGQWAIVTLNVENSDKLGKYLGIVTPDEAYFDAKNPLLFEYPIRTPLTNVESGTKIAALDVRHLPGVDELSNARVRKVVTIPARPRLAQAATAGDLNVALRRTATAFDAGLSHLRGILNATEDLSFNQYLRFMDMIFCNDPPANSREVPERFPDKHELYRELRQSRTLPFPGSDAYRVVKAATEAFVMVNSIFFDPRDAEYFALRDLPFPGSLKDVFERQVLTPIPGGFGLKTLPYLAAIRRKLPDIKIKLTSIEDDFQDGQIDACYGILQERLTNPCMLELIWSYWHEEGALVQTSNAIARRFQNVRSGANDPLANLEIDPLRPLSNLLWGYVQDEQHRLSVVRRNYEYDHHYGLRLDGKAVKDLRPADTRSKFLEAFHNLLRLCNVFYRQDDDTTVKADAFPVLNALKEVHLILTQGQHNQYGDLPSNARIEMLMQQWLLARPEFREFLPTRISVAYPEPWMDRVDAMKKLQGWTDTSVLHFRNLGVFGEQILLGIRWGHWSDEHEPLRAFNWARLLRPQIQGYVHAYRAATGVDLASDVGDAKVDATLPATLLRKRLTMQTRTA